MLVTVVIPVYRDAGVLARTLDATAFGDAEVVVAGADGDLSLSVLRASRPDLAWVSASRGRAADECRRRVAHGDWLLFLHADTRLPQVVGCRRRANRDLRQPWLFRFALDSRRWRRG